MECSLTFHSNVVALRTKFDDYHNERNADCNDKTMNTQNIVSLEMILVLYFYEIEMQY